MSAHGKKPNTGPPIVEMLVGAALVVVVGVAAVALFWPDRKTKRLTRPAGGGPVVGLEVGDIAPEIDGEDIDGQRFRLSDYRGKVVVLDFWGDW